MGFIIGEKRKENVKEKIEMPCMCYYTPEEASKRLLKGLCQQIVDEVKYLHQKGDPIGCSMSDIHILLDHLYSGECDERRKS